MVEIAQRMYQRGYVVALEGNISARLGAEFLITPTQTPKGSLQGFDMVLVNQKGVSLDKGKTPSSERLVHLCIYEKRPDVQAVVHAHPPMATAFSVTHTPFPMAFPEMILAVGEIPLVPYGPPGSVELVAQLEPFIQNHHVFLLQNHGLVTVGDSLDMAYFRLEIVEHYAKILWTAKHLGPIQALSLEQIEALTHRQEGK